MLDDDRRSIDRILDAARDEAARFLAGLDDRPAAHRVPVIEPLGLPAEGLGAEGALAVLRERYQPWLSGSPGPRYFGFVTGGTTPAALAGDWLTAAWDQNLSDAGESSARQLALDAVGMVRELIGLPEAFGGAFVTGATAANLVGLACARQWVGRERGVDAARDGALALGPVRVLSGTAHGSVGKALSVLGLGRSALTAVPTLPEREAVDVEALAGALETVEAAGEAPAVVVANAGTVNTCDFDDLEGIAALGRRFRFWLHVDGAFGALAACSPRFAHLAAGLGHADSVTVDGHKWLNVPYDSAVALTRHPRLQGEVFASAAAYLPAEVRPDTFIHLTPENSQRLRAVPAWMTLAAYGRAGYAEIVERCCRLAGELGARIAEHPRFDLLAPVRVNGVCLGLRYADGAEASPEETAAWLARLQDDGAAFLTGTRHRGRPAARGAIGNWRTRDEDVERTWEAMLRCLVPAA